MPPRKRPPASSSARRPRPADPGAHLQPFLHYIETECGMAANSVAAYRSDLVQFFDWFRANGPASLRDVDISVLTNYLEHLHARKLAASTIARHLVSIKMLFRYLVLEGVLLESSVELLSSPKLWQHLPSVLSPEVVDRLLTEPNPDDRYPFRDRAILSLLYATGCRASETTHLTLSDVHLDESYCRCVGKGNKERLVSLNPLAIAAVTAYLEKERPQMTRLREASWLFVTRSGNRLSRVMIWRIVKRYAARVGCSGSVSPHTLRHSFATHMLAGGAEIRSLQEILGHANIRTTQIYTHVDHSRLKAVHSRHHPRA